MTANLLQNAGPVHNIDSGACPELDLFALITCSSSRKCFLELEDV